MVLPSEHAIFGRRQPLLSEMAVHHWDLLRLTMDEAPSEVVCRAWTAPASRLIGSGSAAAMLSFPGGLIAS